MAECAICYDALTNEVSLRCGHTFCRRCIDRWTQTQSNSSRCPMCRERYSLEPEFEIEDSVSFTTSGRVNWENFIDYRDPGNTFQEFVQTQASMNLLGPMRSRRDMYRSVIRTRSRAGLGRLLRNIGRSLAIYRYNPRSPPPFGLFDHWRPQFSDLVGTDPNRIAFFLANSGLARVDITSGPGDSPPLRLYHCLNCSRFVTSSHAMMDLHRCSVEYLQVTTHHDL